MAANLREADGKCRRQAAVPDRAGGGFNRRKVTKMRWVDIQAGHAPLVTLVTRPPQYPRRAIGSDRQPGGGTNHQVAASLDRRAHGEVEVAWRCGHSQFATSAGFSFWIRTVNEPSACSFRPSVGLPMLYRPKPFSTNSMLGPYIAMFQNTDTGRSLPASKCRTYLFAPLSCSPLSSTLALG
jgi:hypothetical protein